MASRNANGEGTIYSRKDGRYEAAIYVHTTSGSRKRVRVYGKTRGEVHEKLTEIKTKSHLGIPIPDRNWRLGDYLDNWLERIVRPKNRPATYELYEVAVRLNLKPGLGAYQLNRLTVPLVQTFFNQLITDGHSVRKVDSVRETLSSALGSACREELLSRNVASLVRLPAHQKGDVIPWTVDEAKQFLHAAQNDSMYPAFLLSLVYGMRRGEVLGVRWEDVDFDRGVLRVRQQVQRTLGELRQSPLKTDAGKRDLPLVDLISDALHQYRKAKATDDELVFTTRSGLPIEPRNYSRSFRRICRQSGIRQINLHHARHTTATLLKDLSVPDRDIQLILGHSHVSITQQIYQHANMASRREAIGKIERIFMRTSGSLRCRQELPSEPSLLERITTLISGTPGRIRTCDPLVRSSIQKSPECRFTDVKRTVDDSKCVWLVGCVAVSAAVNLLSPR